MYENSLLFPDSFYLFLFSFFLSSSVSIDDEEEDMDYDENMMLDDNTILQHGDEFAMHLAEGLSDNWSQVN